MIQIRSARAVDLPGVAVVLLDAFSDKMRIIFGRHPQKIYTLLEAMYSGPVQRGYDGVIVAERDGRIVGTLIVQPAFYTPQESRMIENLTVRELGLPHALLSAFKLSLFSHTPAINEAYIGDVGVASHCQGEGIGQRLMAHAETWARQNHRARMTLWVAATNLRAVHVYEKAGFTTTRTRSSLLIRLFFGIRQWNFMEKRLD
jgi:ribosomal protein S18 acetylase RimI-like enzyme